MIGPLIRVDGGHYMDAGIRSNENLDLAAEYDELLVVSPRGATCPQAFGGRTLHEETAELLAIGRRVDVVEPEGDALDLVCEHMMDSSASDDLAALGREQGGRLADRLSFLAAAR